MPRTIFAFNGDLESRLALHWLVHERSHEVVTLSLDLGQEVYLEPLGELALELGAVAAQVVDRREVLLRDFALPVLQADAIYQSGCFLGSALARYVIAQELVRVAHEEGSQTVAHAAASKGNDQVRMEAAIAALDPRLQVLTPVRQWNLRTLEDKLNYARRRRLPIVEQSGRPVTVDRNLWGASIYLDDLVDSWEEPPANLFTLTRAPEEAPAQPTYIVLGFEEGIPRSLNGSALDPLTLVRELERLGGEHGIGRCDVVEDRLFGIKSREFYEVPAPTLLLLAHRDLESLVQSRELIQLKETLSRRYAELVYTGLWFHDLRRSLAVFFEQTQQFVTGEVRLKLYKGNCRVVGRRSPHSLHDSRLASLSNLELFDSQWAQGFTSLWTLPARWQPDGNRLSDRRSAAGRIGLYRAFASSQDVSKLERTLFRPLAAWPAFVSRSRMVMSNERIPMSREGYEKLKADLDRMQNAEMIAVTKRIAAARELGDLSENAEYHAAREDQGMLQARIDSLKDKLSRAYLVDTSNMSNDSVVFGVRVRVKDLDADEEEVYVLVGPGDEDYDNNKILTSSPIGQGLLGKKLGDVAEIQVPRGQLRYEVLEISLP